MKSNLRRKGLIAACDSIAQSITGTWRQELMERPWRVQLAGLFLMACSACFLIITQDTSIEVALPTVSYALLYQLSVKKMHHRLAHKPVWWEHFLN